MQKLIFLLGALVCGPAEARIVKVDVPLSAVEIDLGRVSGAMRDAGHPVESAQCSGVPAKCEINVTDPSNADSLALAPFFSGPSVSQRRALLVAELDALEAKLDDGTATPADVRRAVKLILKLSGFARRS